jgi:hypothetical protein
MGRSGLTRSRTRTSESAGFGALIGGRLHRDLPEEPIRLSPSATLKASVRRWHRGCDGFRHAETSRRSTSDP